MPGIFQSTKAISQGRPACSAACAWATASSPEEAVVTAKLMRSSISLRMCLACSLSSTTSTCRPRRSGLGSKGAWRGVPSPRWAVNQKVLPTPGRLCTPTSPPIRVASFLEMASPRPVPPYLRVVDESPCSNERNSRDCCSGVRPMPVSCTSKRSSTPASSREASVTRTMISPSSVNLTALLA